MNADQVIESTAKAVSGAVSAPEYCFLWIDWWPMCMTKSEWSGWMQAIGALLAIGAAFFVMHLQQRAERMRDRATAAALLSSFIGSLHTVGRLLPPDGSRSLWTAMRVRVLIESEYQRSGSVAMHVLSLEEQRGVFNYRMSSMQLTEALRVVEQELDETAEDSVIHPVAYSFLQEVIAEAHTTMAQGRELLGAWIKD